MNAGVTAHVRRRTEVGSFGWRIPLLHKFIETKFYKNCPHLAPSRDTIRRIFTAPKPDVNGARYYQNYISARPVRVRNDATAGTQSSHRHVCFSAVKMARELCAKHAGIAMAWSVDDKAKVPLGCAAVGRLGKQRKFFTGNFFS